MKYCNDEFYWGMFSDKVEHYYEKFGGIRIPNEYAKEFVPNAIPNDDEYTIKVTLRNGSKEDKIIYGFNSKETYDKIIQAEDERVMSQIKKLKSYLKGNIPIQEAKTMTYPSFCEADYHVAVINMFFDDFLNGRNDLTELMASLIEQSVKWLEKYVEDNDFTQKSMRYFTLAIENGKDVLEQSTIIELHKI